MQKIVKQGNKALEGALARVVNLPPPAVVNATEVKYRADGYDDYSDSVYVDAPYDDYSDYDDAPGS